MTQPQNPYSNRRMLPPDSDMFFGREREMNNIRDLISASKCVSIVGERRIGKSSLAFRIFHKLQNTENTIAIFMDCDVLSEKCASRDDFFKIINDRFKQSANNHQIQSQDDYFACYSTFKRFIEKQAKQGLNFAIFIDEFERLPQMEFADDSFFSNLRSIANNPMNHLAFVTISKQDLRKLAHQSIQSSNFWNIFHPFTLGLIGGESTQALRSCGFTKAGFELTPEDIKTIDYYAGRFPFFNQIVCQYLFEAKALNTSVNQNQIINDLHPHYKTIWDLRTRQEQKLLKKLGHGNLDKQEFVLNDMVVRGLVQKENDNYFAFSRFFDDLIEKSFKVKKIEGQLDSIIARTKDVIDIIKGAKGIIK